MKNKSYNQLWIIFLILVILPFFSLSCKYEVEKNEMLSVEETLGLAYLGPRYLRHAYSMANPDALPELREILKLRVTTRHGNIARMIGYIGEAEDVESTRMVIDRLGRVPNINESQIIWGIFEAWAVMARRGITEADEEIRKWCTFQKWDEEFGEILISQKYEYAWKAIQIYGIHGDIDWRPLRDELLEGVEDEEIYKRISGYLSEDLMVYAIMKRKDQERGRITEEEREILIRLGYEEFQSLTERLKQQNEGTRRGDNDITAENIP